MVFRYWVIAVGLLWITACGQAKSPCPELPESNDPSETVAVLLSIPEEDIDLTWSKLVIDELIDKDANLSRDLAEIEEIAAYILERIPENSSNADKVEALRRYIYKPGYWNDNNPYEYDFDDPQGLSAERKSLHRYLTKRKGNCINMPFLFLAVGERMGVEMNVTTAPRHVFIQFHNDETGKLEHLETTSGAQPQRLVWQRQVFSMTDRSLESGMYFQRLSKRQQVAVMAEALLHKTSETGDYEERLELARLILDVFPQADTAILHRITSIDELVQKRFISQYPDVTMIPPATLQQIDALAYEAYSAEDSLKALGWQPYKQNENVILPGEGKPEAPTISAN